MKSKLYALVLGALGLYVGQNANTWGILPDFQDTTPVPAYTAIVDVASAQEGVYRVSSSHYDKEWIISGGPKNLKVGDAIFIGRAWPWQPYQFVSYCDGFRDTNGTPINEGKADPRPIPERPAGVAAYHKRLADLEKENADLWGLFKSIQTSTERLDVRLDKLEEPKQGEQK